MSIKQILELIKIFVDYVKEAVRQKRIKDLKDAKNAALDKHDNRILEEALGGSAGPVADDKYPGMSKRERKEKKD